MIHRQFASFPLLENKVNLIKSSQPTEHPQRLNSCVTVTWRTRGGGRGGEITAHTFFRQSPRARGGQVSHLGLERAARASGGHGNVEPGTRARTRAAIMQVERGAARGRTINM